jgi:hypothetical protein
LIAVHTAHQMQAIHTRSLPAAFRASSVRSSSKTLAPASLVVPREKQAARRRQHGVVVPQALFGRLFGGGAAKMAPGKNVEEAKAELLQFISGLKRGVGATDSDKQQVDEMAKVLTSVNCRDPSGTSECVFRRMHSECHRSDSAATSGIVVADRCWSARTPTGRHWPARCWQASGSCCTPLQTLSWGPAGQRSCGPVALYTNI